MADPVDLEYKFIQWYNGEFLSEHGRNSYTIKETLESIVLIYRYET